MSNRPRAAPWFRDQSDAAVDIQLKVAEVYAARNRERSYGVTVVWGGGAFQGAVPPRRNSDEWRGEIAYWARSDWFRPVAPK